MMRKLSLSKQAMATFSMGIVCDPNATCGHGTGTCDASGEHCNCFDAAFTDHGDFRRSNGCSVPLHAVNALWIIAAVIWFASCVLAPLAFILVKRRSQKSATNERVHTAVCFVASALSGVVAVLQLVSDGGAIGLDPVVSTVFAVSQTVNWTALLLKPSGKSETSIARFALEQAGTLTRRSFFLMLPLLMALIIALSATAIIGATDVEKERPVLIAFFIMAALIYFILSIHMILGITNARRRMETALTNSAMVSRRESVKVRMERFVRRAERVMVISFFVTFALAIFSFTLAVCEPCWAAVWIFVPLISIICSVFICRALALSIYASHLNRRGAVSLMNSNKNAVGEIGKSAETGSGAKDAPKSPGPSVPHRPSRISTNRSSHKKPRGIRPRKLKKMTVVEEAEYEGTVIQTQIDTGTIEGPSRSPRAGQVRMEETVAEELTEEGDSTKSRDATA